MNALERFQLQLCCEAVDRPPNFNIMMGFAAHSIKQLLSRDGLDGRV